MHEQQFENGTKTTYILYIVLVWYLLLLILILGAQGFLYIKWVPTITRGKIILVITPSQTMFWLYSRRIFDFQWCKWMLDSIFELWKIYVQLIWPLKDVGCIGHVVGLVISWPSTFVCDFSFLLLCWADFLFISLTIHYLCLFFVVVHWR